MATITSKNQVTLPKKVMASLNLKTGDKIDFIIFGDRDCRVVPKNVSLFSLEGFLPRSNKVASLEEMEDAIMKGATSDWN